MNPQNNPQSVDQQYIANIRGAAKKRKAAELPQYKKEDVRSQHLEKQRLEIETYLNANPSQAERVNDLNTTAWRVVWQRAKYFTFGGTAYQTTTKKGDAKQISIGKYNSLKDKQKRKYEKIARDGSGQIVEAQRLIEMHDAALTALIAGHKTLTGKVLEPGIKAASAAAAFELRRSLQMPLFEDVAQAEKFHEKAWKLIREELQHSCDQEDTEYFPRLEMADMLRKCKNRLQVAYPHRFTDKRVFNAWKAKSKLLRNTAVSICNGMFSAFDNNSAERKALDKLAEIMRNTLIPSDLQDLQDSAVVELPQSVESQQVKTQVIEIGTGWESTTYAKTMKRRFPKIAAKLA
ncbi:MAG: hypothetical protein EBY32_10890 [Proteobacteria bacterium]|nr:hypothetical protein [Pseudomonadota bacterium]